MVASQGLAGIIQAVNTIPFRVAQTRSAGMTLRRDRVDVWLTPLSRVREEHKRGYLRVLSADEIERWRRFKVEDAKTQYLVAHALLRNVLSRYAPLEPAQWAFATGRHGRPYLWQPAAHRGLVFNISHTRGLVVCALGRVHDLGVDVEHCSRATDLARLAQSFFAPPEAQDIAACSGEAQRQLFFQYWTLKEAYIKARGMGLAIPLDAFWFDVKGPAPRIACSERCQDDPGRWRFWSVPVTPEHRLALAVSSAARAMNVRVRWTLPDDDTACGDLDEMLLTDPVQSKLLSG